MIYCVFHRFKNCLKKKHLFYYTTIVFISRNTVYYFNIKDILFTLDSSAVSDNAGGSSRQKNCLTQELPIRMGLLNIPLTNACRPRILSSKKLGAKLSPSHFFCGKDKWEIGSFCLLNWANNRTKSVYLLKTNQQSPFFNSIRSLYT